MKLQLADNFWSPRMDLNRKVALVYQWEQYGKCGTLGNFQIVAEKNRGSGKDTSIRTRTFTSGPMPSPGLLPPVRMRSWRGF